MKPERRRSPRNKTSAQAELLLAGQQVPIRVPTSDISLYGCYIENMYTLPVGCRMKIKLWIAEKKLDIDGVVKTCDPVFGNGIQFLEMDDQARTELQKYLDAALADEE